MRSPTSPLTRPFTTKGVHLSMAAKYGATLSSETSSMGTSQNGALQRLELCAELGVDGAQRAFNDAATQGDRLVGDDLNLAYLRIGALQLDCLLKHDRFIFRADSQPEFLLTTRGTDCFARALQNRGGIDV